MIKKYNNKKNVAGFLVRKGRERRGVTKAELCKMLELQGIYINRDELLKMEKNELMIKDFELIAIFKILKLDLNKLKDYIGN